MPLGAARPARRRAPSARSRRSRSAAGCSWTGPPPGAVDRRRRRAGTRRGACAPSRPGTRRAAARGCARPRPTTAPRAGVRRPGARRRRRATRRSRRRAGTATSGRCRSRGCRRGGRARRTGWRRGRSRPSSRRGRSPREPIISKYCSVRCSSAAGSRKLSAASSAPSTGCWVDAVDASPGGSIPAASSTVA